MKKMNVKRLSEMQKVLDDRIMKEHGLENKDLEENKNTCVTCRNQ